MNKFAELFKSNEEGMINKFDHYFEIYNRHLEKFFDKEVHVLEIGVYEGGSLQLWKKCFGEASHIYGVDVNPLCKEFEKKDENIKVYIGDQGDRNFLQTLSDDISTIDILIDDGGHTMEQQIATFEVLYPKLSENGVYICEDTHTSYDPYHGGGYQKKDTFIEYCKNLVDKKNAWQSNSSKLNVDEFTKSTHSITFYSGIVVFEKRKVSKPFTVKSGKRILKAEDFQKDTSGKIKVLRFILKKIPFVKTIFRNSKILQNIYGRLNYLFSK